MEVPRILNQRGQVSIEYLLVLVMMFSYLTIVIFPILEVSTGTATDVSNYSSAKFAVDKFAAASDQLCTGADLSTRVLVIDVPAGVEITYEDHEIRFDMNSALIGRGSDQNIAICGEVVGGACVEWICDNDTKQCHGRAETECAFHNALPEKLLGGNKYELKLKKQAEKIQVST